MMTLRARVARSRLWPMLHKEFIQMRRDRLTLAMMIGIPAAQLMLFGYAIRTEVRHLPTVVLDESRTAESRALVDAMANTGNFRIVGDVPDRATLERRIASGAASAGIVIPPTFAGDLARGRTATTQVLVDAADPLASSSAIAAAAQVAAAHGARLARERGAGAPRLEVRVRPLYNPGLRSEAYIVPGIIGVLLSMTMLIITSMSVVRERERGTLEQLIVTPIDKTSLMLGKLLPFVLVGFVQMTVVLLLGDVLFHVPARGSLLLLYAITFAFIVANLGVGLLISTVARTQAQAMQLGYFFLLPNILLSGFMFPRAAMPEPAQWIGLLLPLTYYLRVLRGVLLKGVGASLLWGDTLVLVGFAAVLVTLSVRRFSKTIE
ncbi:MAG TPA: ABC transporter permease [Gemmatimonadaceae bacterium]|nr:ABC transporter permease [Gemmatimonadaceae bacterium]